QRRRPIVGVMFSGLSDSELLRCYSIESGDDAFAELVRRYLTLVYHAALRQLAGDAHLAEEVSQRVFALLATKARSLDQRTTLAGWLHTTTRFVASEARRSERRRRAREQEAYRMQIIEDNAPEPAWEELSPL